MHKSDLMDYEKFLSSKPIYYKEIDYERFPRIFKQIKLNTPPIIHILGTNGKGSTGRFLTQILSSSGKKVAHYSSPHIFDFSERFYSSCEVIDKDRLNLAHIKLLDIFNSFDNANQMIESLSYFEWATLMAGVLFDGYDYLIMEAGMGGEYDATNAFDKILSIFTPIGLDHTDMLGDTLSKIATTKLNAMGGVALVSSEFACKDIAKEIAKSKNTNLIFQSDIFQSSIDEYAKRFNLPEFLKMNLSLAANAAHILGVENLDNIILNLDKLSLIGRCQRIKDNLIVDVGHNPHAAKAVAKYLQDIGWDRVNLIYNAFDDKDIFGVLSSLKPFIDTILVYNYPSQNRKLAVDRIIELSKELKIKCFEFKNLDEKERYLLFGSFMLVENFIKEEIER
ncbi:bifunctional folylpolyglutamate synthase/dihydrofolate synthase [Campylobacter sp. CX2-4080-23]|nr:bifunctional folylpolyglutamate synthase/dihydrofolate synthase [Campylobacter sp. CX2-4080-23]